MLYIRVTKVIRRFDLIDVDLKVFAQNFDLKLQVQLLW